MRPIRRVGTRRPVEADRPAASQIWVNGARAWRVCPEQGRYTRRMTRPPQHSVMDPEQVSALDTLDTDVSGALEHRERGQAVGRAAAAQAIGAGASGAIAVGALAVGALAIGAIAIGTLAIGRLVVNRLSIRRTRIDRLEIAELEVRRLRVEEVLVTKRFSVR